MVALSIIAGKKFKDFTDQRVKDPKTIFPSLFKSMNRQSAKLEADKSLMAKIKADRNRNEYLYSVNPASQMEASEDSNFIKLKNHIVVCGIHSSIYEFVLPLRAKYLKNYMQDIVIIADFEAVPVSLWESIHRFQNIFLIFGSPLDKEILTKA